MCREIILGRGGEEVWVMGHILAFLLFALGCLRGNHVARGMNNNNVCFDMCAEDRNTSVQSLT